MTRITTRRRRQVVGWLHIHTWVTTDVTCRTSASCNTRMSIGGNKWEPGDAGAVADITRLGRRDMRSGFSGRIRPVVARGTSPSHYTLVGEAGRLPLHGSVADITRLRRRNVRRRFGLGIDCRIASTVAGRTLSRRAGVAHRRWLEGSVVRVAGVTLCRGRDVRRRLAQGIGPVVAG